MRRTLLRWLYLSHRWLGIILCAFFAMWFFSGVVMMYVGYPKLTEAERLARLPMLDAGTGLLAPAEALTRAGTTGPLRELRLAAAVAGQPVYVAIPHAQHSEHAPRRRSPGAGAVVVDARTGERLQRVDQDLPTASAAAFAGPGVSAEYLGTVQEDAFTHSRALDAHRPLHRVQLGDADRTLLYVSGLTGEVVRDATTTERVWNYAGAWIHWLYPFRGNLFDQYWADIVNWLSIAGIVAAVSGTVVGILRWRFWRPYRSGSRTPYGRLAMRWHHVLGLLFALATIAWIFSGLMSMNPWRIFDTGSPELKVEAMHGGPLQLTLAETEPERLLLARAGLVSELRWTKVMGKTVVLAAGPSGSPALLDGASGASVAVKRDDLLAAAARLVEAPIAEVEDLKNYDIYYYSRAAHTMTGGADKPLPVLRVKFADRASTWVHIDSRTGRVLGKTDSGRRRSRWLFAMLHSWDWLPLLEHRPMWDIVLVALSAGGLLLSVTGVVIGWRRLRLTAQHTATGLRMHPRSRERAASASD
jgi:uncharacterized iron-regulated membrane protein